MNNYQTQILENIIKPVNDLIGLGGESSDKIVLCTFAVETNFQALRQADNGPAFGWGECEKPTYDYIIDHLNRFSNKKLKEKVLAACLLDIIPPIETLMWNLRLSAAFVRLRYWLVEDPLPPPNDLDAMAHYWLKYYNGDGQGKGTIERFTNVCKPFFN